MEPANLPAAFGKADGNLNAVVDARFAKSRRTEIAGESVSVGTQAAHYDDAIGRREEANSGIDEDGDGIDVAAFLAHDLPVSHEVVLKDHAKAVSALAVDPSGARIASGGYDYECKLWDFGGMDASFKPFRTFEPCENYQVHDIAFSQSGDSFLVACGNWQPKLISRDGSELAEYAKGDMYLRDLKHTAGHIAELTSCQWHPSNQNIFLTSANDSSIRVWDANIRDKSKGVIVAKSKERGTRTRITAATYSRDGRCIAGAGLDGTLHVWAANSNFARPNSSIENAHVKNETTSGLVYSLDNHSLLSRGGDGTVKLWDTRYFKSPKAVRDDLPSLNAETNLIISPDEQFVLTGTAGSKPAVVPGHAPDLGTSRGKVVVMKRDTLEVAREVAISVGSVIRVAWHAKINQVFASTSLGMIHVLYSPELSQKGATMSMSRQPRKAQAEDVLMRADGMPHLGQIVLPNAIYKEDSEIQRSARREAARARKDPLRSKKPLPPVKGPGRGGRVGASATQHVVKNLVRNDTLRDEDPREALLRFAADHQGDAAEWTKAWAETQPKPVYSRVESDTDEEVERQREEHRAAHTS